MEKHEPIGPGLSSSFNISDLVVHFAFRNLNYIIILLLIQPIHIIEKSFRSLHLELYFFLAFVKVFNLSARSHNGYKGLFVAIQNIFRF